MNRLFFFSLVLGLCFAGSAYGAPAVVVAKNPGLTCPQTELGDDSLQARYGEMWEQYSADAHKATETLQAEIEKQRKAATALGNLDLALFWKTIGQEFQQKGELKWDEPSLKKTWNDRFSGTSFPAEFTVAMKKAAEAYKSAQERLEAGYGQLVAEFTKADKLEQALKIRGELKELLTGKAPNQVPAATTKPKAAAPFCRLTLNVAANGACGCQIALATDEPEIDDGGKPQKVAEGLWRVVHSFPDQRSSERYALTTKRGTATYSPPNKAIELTPSAEFNGGWTNLSFPYRVRLPVTVVADVEPIGPRAHMTLALWGLKQQTEIKVITDNAFQTCDVLHLFITRSGQPGAAPKVDELFTQQAVSLKSGFKYDVKPIPSMDLTDGPAQWFPQLSSFVGPQKTCQGIRLKRLEVKGRFAPSLGLQLDADGDSVVVKDVLAKGLAERAGLKRGDRIMTVGGKPAAGLARTLQLLSVTELGETWELEVLRGDDKKAFSIQAELL